MDKVSWESFLPEVLPQVPGCPEVTVITAIRSAAIDFCSKTRVWQVDLDTPITLEANRDTYDIDPPDIEYEIVSIPLRGVSYLGVELNGPTTAADLTRDNPGWRNTTATQPVTFIYNDPDKTIRVVPKPTAEVLNALTVRVALKPTRTSENADEYLFNEWLEAIGFGALERLFRIPGKSWSDAELARDYGNKFKKAIGDARARLWKGHGDGSLAVDPRSLGGID